jgi:hypothetical protein
MAVRLSGLSIGQPPVTPGERPNTHFCYRLNRSQGIVRLERLGQFKEIVTLGIKPITILIVTQ